MRCYVFFFYCFFLRREAQFGMQHPMLPGAWGEQPHKPKPPHPKTSAPVFQTFQAVFQRFLHLFYARKAQFGIKRPAFTRGHGGGVSPHIRSVSPASPRSLYARKGIAWDATSHVAGGVGRAAPQTKAPTSKNLYASFPNISSSFSAFSTPVLCPQGHHLGLNALRLRGGMRAARAPIYNDPLRMCASLARSAQWEWPCHCRGVGAASAPT